MGINQIVRLCNLGFTISLHRSQTPLLQNLTKLRINLASKQNQNQQRTNQFSTKTMQHTLKMPCIQNGVAWWKCKDAVSYYTASNLTKEGCQRDCRASSHLTLPCHLLWISSSSCAAAGWSWSVCWYSWRSVPPSCDSQLSFPLLHLFPKGQPALRED